MSRTSLHINYNVNKNVYNKQIADVSYWEFLYKFCIFLTVGVILMHSSFAFPEAMIMQNILLESPYYGLSTSFVFKSLVKLLGYILPFTNTSMFTPDYKEKQVELNKTETSIRPF